MPGTGLNPLYQVAHLILQHKDSHYPHVTGVKTGTKNLPKVTLVTNSGIQTRHRAPEPR